MCLTGQFSLLRLQRRCILRNTLYPRKFVTRVGMSPLESWVTIVLAEGPGRHTPNGGGPDQACALTFASETLGMLAAGSDNEYACQAEAATIGESMQCRGFNPGSCQEGRCPIDWATAHQRR